MRTSFCSANCDNCNKVANECGAVKESRNPDTENNSLFSRPGFEVDVSKFPFGISNFLGTSSWTHSSVIGPSKTTTPFDYSATPLHFFKFPPTPKDTTASVKASQNPDNEKGSLFSGFDASKSLFGNIGSSSSTGTTTTTAPLNPNPFAPSPWSTHSSVFGPSKTTTPFDHSANPFHPFKFPPISTNDTTASALPGDGKTQVCNECGAVKESQNLDIEKSSLFVPRPRFGVECCSGGFVPSNSVATSSWAHSSVFGPSKLTTPFDHSTNPFHSFKFPPTSSNTTASAWKPTTQPQHQALNLLKHVCEHKPYSETVSPYDGGMIITSISAMPVYADKSHEQIRFQHYQSQGTPAVDQLSKSTISAQPQLTLPIFVLTMMGSSVGLTQIGTLPATPSANGNGMTISGSPTFGSQPTTIASFGTGPPSSGMGSSPTHLFGATAL